MSISVSLDYKAMSGAFETAAGAFAVVGVADVVFRTGREIYKLLGEVADAPQELVRLRQIIDNLILLDKPVRKCLDDLKNRSSAAIASDAVPPLESALRALQRELHTLKTRISRVKGSKTWSSVKLVLQKKQLDQTISKLEFAKTSLATTLPLAIR
jgi:hypothetical protein